MPEPGETKREAAMEFAAYLENLADHWSDPRFTGPRGGSEAFAPHAAELRSAAKRLREEWENSGG